MQSWWFSVQFQLQGTPVIIPSCILSHLATWKPLFEPLVKSAWDKMAIHQRGLSYYLLLYRKLSNSISLFR